MQIKRPEAGEPLFCQLNLSLSGRRVKNKAAFSAKGVLTILTEIPRALGATEIIFSLHRDGGETIETHLALTPSDDYSFDTAKIELDLAELAGEGGCGLFYYEFFLVRHGETLFSDSPDQVSLQFCKERGRAFRLLLCKTSFDTPHWFYGGVMYHIFLDRFYKGQGDCKFHKGAILEEDWEHGIPEYPEIPGDELANNRFFGGNLWGVIEKLEHLQSLSVTTLYLSPIFDSVSNHRYDTGDYEVVDSLLGGDKAFAALLREAHKRGMRVILDGVFNHTGDDSRYFNRLGNYPGLGAYQSEKSPYRDWFRFGATRDDYESWWGIRILPRLNHENQNCRHYFTGKDGIAAKWLRFGADGWRLDVADELSDVFLDELRATVKSATNGEGLIIGEVWENAADKISYDRRRRYFQGDQLDSVMNYPMRSAILEFLRSRDAKAFCNSAREIYASYPEPSVHALMNLLSTHDTARILTILGDPTEGQGLTNVQKATARLTEEQRKKALRLLRIGATLQFTLFGVPSIYYGDEAGMEGYGDPFCRFPYPWGREDKALLAFYRELGRVRTAHSAFADGVFEILCQTENAFFFLRKNKEEEILVGVNLSERVLPLPEGDWEPLFPEQNQNEYSSGLPPMGAAIYQKKTCKRSLKKTGKGNTSHA